MDSKDEWADRSKRFFKAELKRRDVTYEELARRLSEMGMDESEGSVAMKINRGAFPTWFFLASMKAIGCMAVRVEDV
jgi:hypothetical protein